MGKTAIILGATGLTGSLVMEQLCANEMYSKIKVFGRNYSGVENEKVEEFIGDMLQMETFAPNFTGDEVFVCIGTTRKKTPDKVLYRLIDYGIPVAAAKLAKSNGIGTIAVVSAIGANSKSSFEYNRIKGDMERDVMNSGVHRVFLLRPSFIAGPRKEKRAGERFGIFLFRLIGPLLIGSLKKYRAVQASAIAAKMIQLANSNEKSQIIESDQI